MLKDKSNLAVVAKDLADRLYEWIDSCSENELKVLIGCEVQMDVPGNVELYLGVRPRGSGRNRDHL